MSSPLAPVGALLLSLLVCGTCASAEGEATWYSVDWVSWRPSSAFGIGDTLFWVKIEHGEVHVSAVVDGQVTRVSSARTSVPNPEIAGRASNADRDLFFVVTALAGGPTEVFRFDIESGVTTSYWKGDIHEVVIGMVYLPEANACVVIGQNGCYLIGADGEIEDFGPMTHVEGGYHYSAFAADSKALVLNLDTGMMAYEPGSHPKRIEGVDPEFRVWMMASVGDDWIVRLANAPPGRLGLRLTPATAKAGIPIRLPPDIDWELTDYGETAVFWSTESSEVYFVTSEGLKIVRMGEGNPSWRLLAGYSQDRVFLVSRDGYATLEMP